MREEGETGMCGAVPYTHMVLSTGRSLGRNPAARRMQPNPFPSFPYSTVVLLALSSSEKMRY